MDGTRLSARIVSKSGKGNLLTVSKWDIKECKNYVLCIDDAHNLLYYEYNSSERRRFYMSTVNVTIRMDDELKKQAEELFSDLGLSMTAAFIAFTRQAVREQRIPFNISRNVPNTETIAAIKEVDRMKLNPQEYKGYNNVDDMMRELLK